MGGLCHRALKTQQAHFCSNFSVGRWPRKVSSCAGISDDWCTGAVGTWVGSTFRNAGMAKRRFWRNLGSDGNRPKNFLSWRVHSRAKLLPGEGQPRHGTEELVHFGTLPLPAIGNIVNRLWLPERGQGQGHSKVLDACQAPSDGSRQSSSPGSGLGFWAENWGWSLVREEGVSNHQTPGL